MASERDAVWEMVGATVVVLILLAITVHATVGWSDVGAAWVQAVGSVAAIATAVGLSWHDRKQLKEERRDQAEAAALVFVAFVGNDLKALASHLHEILKAMETTAKPDFKSVRGWMIVLAGFQPPNQAQLQSLSGRYVPQGAIVARAVSSLQAFQRNLAWMARSDDQGDSPELISETSVQQLRESCRIAYIDMKFAEELLWMTYQSVFEDYRQKNFPPRASDAKY